MSKGAIPVKATSLFLVLTAALATSSSALFANTVAAVPSSPEVTVRVDGLACPFCAYGLEKRLKKLDGFKLLGINVKESTAKLAVAPSQAADYRSLREAVEKAGFTPRQIQVEGSAILEEDGKQWILVSEDGIKLFSLEYDDIVTALGFARPVHIRFSGEVVAMEKRRTEHRLPLLVLMEASPVKEARER